MGALTFVSSTSSASNNPTSGDFTLPSEWAAGDCLVCWWYTRESSKTFTAPSEITQAYNTSASSFGRLYIGYRQLQSGDTNFAWTSSSVSGSTTAWGCAAFRNVDFVASTNPIEADSGAPSTFTNAQNPNPPAATVVHGGAAVITIVGKNNDYTGVTPPTGFSNGGTASSTAGNDACGGLAYILDQSAGTVDPTAWTFTGGATTDDGYRWTGVLRPDFLLVGAVSTAVTTAAALTTEIQCSAAVTGTVTTAAGLTTEIQCVAAVTGAVTTVAALTTEIQCSAAVTGTVTTAAALTTEIQCAAAVTSAVTTAAAFTTEIQCAAAVTGAVTAVAGLTTEITLIGAAAGAVTTAAALTTGITCQAGVIGAVSVIGSLGTEIRCAATASLTILTAGALTTSGSEGQVVVETIVLPNADPRWLIASNPSMVLGLEAARPTVALARKTPTVIMDRAETPTILMARK